jgi:hypothetical protein
MMRNNRFAGAALAAIVWLAGAAVNAAAENPIDVIEDNSFDRRSV